MKKEDNNIEIYKEKVSVRAPQNSDFEKQDEEINLYYAKISIRYRIAKIFTVVFLCIFILSSLFIYGDKFTYENARYVLRDLGQILSEDSLVPSEKIIIDPDGDMDFGIYRKNIVIAGESTTKILSVTGKEKLIDNTKYTSPTVVSSDKYCIVYSLGAYNLSVYNTVARVYDMKFDTQIYDVAVSDNGYIAVMTDSREFRCVVYLYNSDFKLVSTYNKTRYPSSVELSSDGSVIYISSFGAENGEYVTQLSAYEKRSEQPLYQFNYNQSQPLDLMLFSDQNTAMVLNDRIVFADKYGNKINENIFSSGISHCSFNNDILTVSDQNKQSNIKSFDSSGNVLLSIKQTGLVGAYSINSGILIRLKDTLVFHGEESGKEIELSTVPQKILYNDGYVFVCNSETIFSYKT